MWYHHHTHSGALMVLLSTPKRNQKAWGRTESDTTEVTLEPRSPTLQAILYQLSHKGSPREESTLSRLGTLGGQGHVLVCVNPNTMHICGT